MGLRIVSIRLIGIANTLGLSVAGVVAAVGPARRAAKLDILDAIASH